MFIILLSLVLGRALFAAEPVKIVAANTNEWQQPVYDPSGRYLAFTNTSQKEIWLLDLTTNKTSRVVQALQPGRRFCFEPGEERLVFRQASMGDPSRSERMLSTSLFLFDPVPRSHNTGSSFGPYRIENRIWYRTSLSSPLLDCDEKSRIAGPYLDTNTGAAWVLSTANDTIYRSQPGERIVGMEISPNGSHTAFVMEQPQISLVVVAHANAAIDRIPNGRNPGWSGDSKFLAYVLRVSPEDTGEIHVFRLSDDLDQRIELGSSYRPSDPALDQSATRVAFVSNGEIYQIPLLR